MSKIIEINENIQSTNLEINDILQMIIQDEEIDTKTRNFLSTIKNKLFLQNIYDNEKKLIVNSVYLNKITKTGRGMSTMVWQYFRHRGKLNVNDVIQKYGRDNLTINYKIFQ